MAKLAEIITEAEVRKLYPDAQDTLLRLAAVNEAAGRQGISNRFALTKRYTPVEIAESLLRAVHGMMMSRAQLAPSAPHPFTHVYVGPLVDIVEAMAGNAWDRGEMRVAAKGIARQLTYFKYVRNTAKGAHPKWLIRAWPVRARIGELASASGVLTTRDEARMQKRIAEESGTKVVVTHSLSEVSKPKDATPEELVAYVDRIAAAFTKLERAFRDQTRELEEANAKIEAFVAAEGDAWQGAGEEIERIIAEASTSS